MAKIRLLIASDFRLMRRGLRHLITVSGDIQVVAESELNMSLLQLIHESSPDVVLLDLALSQPHNTPAVSQLLEQQLAKVVVVSTSDNLGYVRSLLTAGVLGYMLASGTEEQLFIAILSAHQGRYFIDPQLSDALADVLVRGQTADKRSRRPGGLSKRELEVLIAVARGFTSSEIANQLDLSHKTVETYRTRIYEKLRLKTRAELVGYVIASGLLLGKSG